MTAGLPIQITIVLRDLGNEGQQTCYLSEWFSHLVVAISPDRIVDAVRISGRHVVVYNVFAVKS